MAGSARRSAILDSAVAEFSAHGYHGARVERIAAAAGANKQLIFHYFGSKDGLYTAAVAKLFTEAPAPVTDASSPPDRLKRTITQFAAWLDSNRGAALALAESSPGGDAPPESASACSSWISRQLETVRSLIDDGQRQGFFRDDVDAQAIAEVTLASLVGMTVVALFGAGADAQRQRAENFSRMVSDLCAWR